MTTRHLPGYAALLCVHSGRRERLTRGLLVCCRFRNFMTDNELDAAATCLAPLVKLGKPPEDRRLPIEAVQRFKRRAAIHSLASYATVTVNGANCHRFGTEPGLTDS